MTRYLTLNEVLELYRRVMAQTGGAFGLSSPSMLESAIAQPAMTYAGEELYPSIAEKASALGFSLVQGQPFLDGNKRVGHAAMETFLVLNGHELLASVDEQETVILRLAEGKLTRHEFTSWLGEHIVPIAGGC